MNNILDMESQALGSFNDFVAQNADTSRQEQLVRYSEALRENKKRIAAENTGSVVTGSNLLIESIGRND